jgi:polyisoprenoid-binding protein YceI
MRKAPGREAAVAVLAGLIALASGQAQPVTPAPLAKGEVTFLVHSTIVGSIHGWAPVAQAAFTGDQLSSVHGLAEVRVADMQTGNGTRDRHLREAMEADGFPTIRFELESVEPTTGGEAADSAAFSLRGQLTLHGVTRPVQASATVSLRPDGVDVVATFPVDMRDYGIKPPVRALVLRVAPDVVVTARLSFGAPSSP